MLLLGVIASSRRRAAGQVGAGIEVTWSDQSADEDGFRIYYGTDGVIFGDFVDTAPNVESVNIGNLIDGQLYYFYVVAFNSAGESDPTPIEAAYAGTQPPPQTWVLKQGFEATGATGYDNGETWVEQGTVNSKSTVSPIKGAQSFRINAAASGAYTAFAPADDYYGFVRYRVDTSPGNWYKFGFLDSSLIFFVSAATVAVGSVGGVHAVHLYSNGGDGAPSAVEPLMATNLYCWLDYHRNGTCVLRVSGTSTKPTAPGAGVVYLERAGENLDCGAFYFSSHPTDSVDVTHDNVLVSPDPIGNNPNP